MSTREQSTTPKVTNTNGTPKRPRPRRPRATQRERQRMQLLNQAFENLRRVVPRTHLADYQRLSKIATLRLAIQYIRAMAQILTDSSTSAEGNTLVLSSLIDLTNSSSDHLHSQNHNGIFQNLPPLQPHIPVLEHSINNNNNSISVTADSSCCAAVMTLNAAMGHQLVEFTPTIIDW